MPAGGNSLTVKCPRRFGIFTLERAVPEMRWQRRGRLRKGQKEFVTDEVHFLQIGPGSFAEWEAGQRPRESMWIIEAGETADDQHIAVVDEGLQLLRLCGG